MNPSDNNNLNFFNKKPIQFLAGIYIYLIVIVIIVGLIYVYNLNKITTQTVPPRLVEKEVENDLQMQPGRVIPAFDVSSLMQPSTEFIEKGKELYNQSCSSCHGNTGKGDGTAGEALTPKPRNFTDSTKWVNGYKLNEIYKTLEEGIPGSGMASYNYLLPEDKFALVSYIRYNFVNNPPQLTEDDLINLDMNYNLSQGVSLPAQIPVAEANKIILSEGKGKVEKIHNIISSIKKVNKGVAKKLFYKVTDNQFAAIVTLNSDLAWKKDQKLFVDAVVNDALNNGFNNKVFQLTASQWNVLYSLLKDNIK